MEQAISTLGRSLSLKREEKGLDEVVSFEYQPHQAVEHQKMGGVTVYVTYFSDPNGVRVRVIITPTVLTMLFLVSYIGLVLLFDRLSPDFSNKIFTILFWLFVYLFNWWETINTIKAVRNMFRDYIIS